jgi:ABC-2 type transport system permease protein
MQVVLVAGLRWRMYRNAMRTWSARFDLLANLLVGGATGSAALVVGAGLGALAFVEAGRAQFGRLSIPLWGVFLAWQVMPILMATFSQEFDFRNLLRFPLRFPALYALSLAYGLFDPVALAALLWLTCMATGIALARPELLSATLGVFLLLALVSLLLNRVIFSWLEKLLARRRTREAVAAILLFSMIAVQLSGAVVERWGNRAAPYVRMLKPLAELLPPGLASTALAGAAMPESGTRATGSATALQVAYLLALGLLLGHRLHQQLAGEDLGHTPAPQAATGAASLAAGAERGWHLPGLSGPVAAMFEKEMRYFLRSGMMLMNVLMPVLFVAFFALVWTQPRARDAPGIFSRMPDIVFPSAVAYALLVLAQMAYNAFAYDGRGVQLLFAAPVRFRDVLLGKNLAYATVIGFDAMLILAVLTFFGKPVSAMTVGATLAGGGFVLLAHFTVGNVMSLYFPKAYDFERMRQRARGMTVFLYLLTQGIVLGIAGGVIAVSLAAGGMALALAVFLALDIAALKIYRLVLEQCTAIARNQREALATELCK